MANEVLLKIRLDGDGVVVNGVRRVSQAVDGMGNSARNTVADIAHLGGAFAVFYGLSGPISGAARALDEFTTAASRIALVSASASSAAAAQSALFQIAQASRVQYAGLAEVYARLARSGNELGISQSRMLGITRSISQAMTISGGSAESMRAALVQLGQGFASGTLRGEELNSVLEQAPRLAQAIADGMGKSVGELRKLGEEGKLTAQAVSDALEKTAPQLAAEFARMTPTIGQAFTVLKDGAAQAFYEFDKGSGASAALAAALTDLGKGLGDAGAAARDFGEKYGTALKAVGEVAAILAATAAIGKLSGAVAVLARFAANPIVIGVSIAVAGAEALNHVIHETESGLQRQIDAAEKRLAAGHAALAASAQASAATQEVVRAGIRSDEKALSSLTDKLRTLRAEAAAASPAARATAAMRQSDRDWEAEEQKAAQAQIAGRKKAFASYMQEVQGEKAKQLAAEKDRWTALVAVIGTSGTQYEAALKAHQAKLAEINKKGGANAAKNDEAEIQRSRLDEIRDAAKLEIDLVKKRVAERVTAEEDGLEQIRALQIKAAQDEIAVLARRYEATGDRGERARLLTEMQRISNAATIAVAEAEAGLTKLEGLALRAHQDWMKGVGDETAALLEKARAAEQENALIGMTAEQLAAITRVRYDEKISILETRAETLRGIEGREAELYLIEQQIAALERLKTAEIAKPKLQEQSREWQKFADDIERSLTDSLYRAFEAGEDMGSAFAKALQNTFKTTVLKFAVQMTVDIGKQGVASLIGGGGGSSGGSSLLSSASDASSLYNAVTGGSLLGSSAAYGAAIGTTSIGAGSQAALLAAQTAEFGAAGTLATASAAGTVSSGAASALSTLAAAAPWISGALAIYSYKDKIFGGKKQYTGEQQLSGTFTAADFSGEIGRKWEKDGGWFRKDKSGFDNSAVTGDLDAALDQLVSTTAEQFRSLADSIGADTLGPALDAWSMQVSKDVSAGLDKSWATLSDEVLASMAATLTPSLHGLVKEGENTTATLARVTLETAAVAGALDIMGRSMASVFGGTSLDGILVLTDGLVQLAGGADAFSSKFSAYYDAFYSAEEKTDRLRDGLAESFESLGLALPSSKDAFRNLLESLDLTSAAGQQTFATMLTLAPAFSTLVDSMDATARATARAAAEAAAEQAEAAARVLAGRQSWQNKLDLLTGASTERQQAMQADLASTTDAATQALIRQVYAQQEITAAAEAAAQQAAAVAAERYNLETVLLQAQGDTTALRARELAALDASNRALQEQIWAQQQAGAVANERAGLESRLLQLQGDTAAIRERELAALDESNRALLAQIFALEDAAAAQQAAQQAAEAAARAEAERQAERQRQAEAAAQAAAAIAAERDGLQKRLWQAQGDTKALREAELAALNPANRALQQQIWLLEDQAAAAQKAAQAESERLGLQKQLWQLQGNTAAIRAAELAALDESSRALQQQIWALEDQKAAADEWHRTWDNVTESLLAQAKKIRGELAGEQSWPSLQAQFVTATAAARAGDATAAGSLPGLSDSLLSAYAGRAASQLELQRMQAWVATSLEETAALIVPPSADAQAASEVRALREEQSAQAEAQTRLLARMDKLWQYWNTVGLPATRVET